MPVERALGNMCIAVDRWPQQHTPKLASVEPGSVEGFYMLAAFVFDLSRKMKYLYKATSEFGLQGDPAFAQEVRAHNAELYVRESWETIARRAEAIAMGLDKEIATEHQRILDTVATRKER